MILCKATASWERLWCRRNIWSIGDFGFLNIFLVIVLLHLIAVESAYAQSDSDLLDTESSDRALLTNLRTPRPQMFFGGALSNKRGTNDNSSDGSATIGLSFGDVDRSVNVRVAAVITSLTDSFGDSGYISVRFSRREEIFGIPVVGALSLGKLAGWGDAADNDETVALWLSVNPFYADATGLLTPASFTVGVKSDVSDLFDEPEFFFSTGVRITRNMSASLAWTGESVSIGTALWLNGKLGFSDNVFVGLTLADAFNMENNRRFILRGGISFPIGK